MKRKLNKEQKMVVDKELRWLTVEVNNLIKEFMRLEENKKELNKQIHKKRNKIKKLRE